MDRLIISIDQGYKVGYFKYTDIVEQYIQTNETSDYEYRFIGQLHKKGICKIVFQ